MPPASTSAPARSRSTTPSAPSTSSWPGWRRSSPCVGTRGPAQPTESPRPLANVTTLVGSGGVLRHTDEAGRAPRARRRAGRPRRWLEGAARGERDGRHGIPALCRRPAGRPRPGLARTVAAQLVCGRQSPRRTTSGGSKARSGPPPGSPGGVGGGADCTLDESTGAGGTSAQASSAAYTRARSPPDGNRPARCATQPV